MENLNTGEGGWGKGEGKKKNFFLSRLSLIAAYCLLLTAFPPAGQAAPPQRIVSVNLCSEELLLQLAAPERVAGVTLYPKRPETEKLLAAHPEIRRIPGRLEEVLALKPDLVIAGTFSPRAAVDSLVRLGIPVYLEGVPVDFPGIESQIRGMARALGEEPRGETLVSELKAALAKVPPPEGPSPGILFLGPAGHVTGSGTFEDAVIRAAGGRNLAAEHGLQGHSWIGLETLVAWQPAVLVISSEEGQKDSIGREMLSHPALNKGLPHTRMLRLAPGLTECGSPATPEAVLKIAEALHA